MQALSVIRKVISLVAASLALGLPSQADSLEHKAADGAAGPTRHAAGKSTSSLPARSVRDRVNDAYGKLPLAFELNRGQAGDDVQFLSRAGTYSLYLTRTDAVLFLRKPRRDRPAESAMPASAPATVGGSLRMNLVGANPALRIEGQDPLPGTVNYFIGNDPAGWRTDIATYASVNYRGVYPGIDLVFHGNQRQFEYDFLVAPHADPETITIMFSGAASMRVDDDGSLVLHTADGEIRQRRPDVYQHVRGERRTINARYVLKHGDGVGFEIAAYDHGKPLLIDPVIAYATYVGGTGNEDSHAIAVDADGNAYVAGQTNSTDFPVTAGAPQMTLANNGPGGNPDGFVTKLNPSGTAIVYSTYLGGSCTDIIYAVAVDADGQAVVTGTSGSGINPNTEMPDCSGGNPPFDPQSNPFRPFPQVNPLQSYAGNSDAFVTKLNVTGDGLVYSSFFGGGSSEFGRAGAVDADGNAYLAGDTISSNFPASAGAYQTAAAGGEDAYVVKVDATGALIYATLLGGGGLDSARGVAVDTSGDAHIVGLTGSGSVDSCNIPQTSPFPTTPGAYQPAIAPSEPTNCMFCCTAFPGGSGVNANLEDAFVAVIGATGGSLVYSTYLGGGTGAAGTSDAAFDEGHAIAIDSQGDVYVTGTTGAADFPTKNPYQSSYQGGSQPPGDAFVAKLRLNGAGASDLLYSTYLGSSSFDEGNGIAVNASGEFYVTGTGGVPQVDPLTPCPLPPCVSGGGAFVTKFAADGQSLVYSSSIVGTSTGAGIALGFGSGDTGNVYVTGTTGGGLQTTPDAFQGGYAGFNDAFVVKIGDGATSPVPTSTVTSTPTSTPTLSATRTATLTPTLSPTFTSTSTPTVTATHTPTLTQTSTPTSTPTAAATHTATSTPTPQPTRTATASHTVAATATSTVTPIQCGPAPLAAPSCRQINKPSRHRLAIDNWNGRYDAKDRLEWGWRYGDATSKSDFGDPISTTSYGVCLYDGSGTLIFSAGISPGPLWKDSRRGYLYTNLNASQHGIRRLSLKALTANPHQASIRLVGIGRIKNLGNPSASGNYPDISGFPIATAPDPVRMQLINSDGFCWEAHYQNRIRRNQVVNATVSRFRAKND